MDKEQSAAEAERLLRDSGWAPHPKLGVYVLGDMVMGLEPGGGSFHVKSVTMIPPGHPQYDADTPDEHHEAAAWLIARFAVASGGDAEQIPGDEARGEIGAAETANPSDPLTGNNGGAASGHDEASLFGEVEAPDEAHGEAGGAEEPDCSIRSERDDEADVGHGVPGHRLATAEAAGGDDISGERSVVPADEWLEADYSEIDPPPAASSEPAEPPQNRFYGLDDLDRRRALRIGDVAVIAAERILLVEEEAGETEGEWLRVQGHVVSHLDKFTGAYTHPDTATYDRFIVLSNARARIGSIDEHRKQVTTALLSASREEVEAFDPQDGWPA